jgi:hypothetical protein
MSITVVAAKVRSCLASQNFSRSNTLFGTSSSPDEINTKEESLCKVQEGYLSKDRGVYTLGEIGGWPLSGIESMKDFLSHSPRKGRVFLLFGPNIGINDDGALRKIERLGHSWLSECCEPGLNAYYIQSQIKLEKEGKASEGTLQYNELDSQMQFVMTTMKNYIDTPEASRIQTSAVPAFMTLLMYQIRANNDSGAASIVSTQECLTRRNSGCYTSWWGDYQLRTDNGIN